MTGETKKRLCFGTILFYDEPERMKKAPKKSRRCYSDRCYSEKKRGVVDKVEKGCRVAGRFQEKVGLRGSADTMKKWGQGALLKKKGLERL